jgi:hypothetical protein
MEAILEFLNTSGVHNVIRASTWIWPTMETLHFVGLCLLYGVIAVVDLRLIGAFKNIAYEWVHGLINLAVAGFLINVVTGVLFYIGDPFRYTPNQSFQFKMVCLVLAGINLLIFTFKVKDEAKHVGPGSSTSVLAKCVGAASILLWTGVIAGGRLIPFYGPY